MTLKSFTLQLDGSVSLERLTAALEAWQSALLAISENVGKSHVLGMTIDDLSVGSALVEVEIEFDNVEVAAEFTNDYEQVGIQVRDGNVIDFPANLRRPVEHLRRVAMMEGAKGLMLASEGTDILVQPREWDARRITSMRPVQTEAIGVVIGKLQSLTSRNSLRVTVYDVINDKAVRCALTDEQHERVRDLWDTDVIVEGLIRRDPITGRPLSIREVRSIKPRQQSVDRFAWMRARGALRHIRPDLSSEELIRQARNG